MNIKFFIIMSMIFNVLIMVFFADSLFSTNKVGLLDDDKLSSYYQNDNIYNGYDSNNYQVIVDNQESQINSLVGVTDGKNGVQESTTGFIVIDWLKVVWQYAKYIIILVFGTCYLLFLMPYPFGVVLGLPYTIFYIWAILKFIRGDFF